MFFAPIGWSSYRAPEYIEVITFADHNDSTTILVPNCYRGDFFFFLIRAGNPSTTPTDVIPPGWTGIEPSLSSAGARFRASYKIATGVEDGTTITGMIGTDRARKIMAVIRTDGEIQSIQVSTPVTQGPMSNTPATQTISASAGVPPVMGCAIFGCQPFADVSPRTTSITPDLEIDAGGGAELFLHTYTQETAPANYTFGMNDEGSENILYGFYIHNVLVKSPVLPATLSYIGTAGTTTEGGFGGVYLPATVQGGDLLIFHERMYNDTVPDVVANGFIRVATAANTSNEMRATLSCGLYSAKAFQAGYVIGQDPEWWGTSAIAAFRADTPIRTLTVRDPHVQITQVAPTNQIVLASSGKVPLVVVAGYSSGDDQFGPFGFTPTRDGIVYDDNDAELAYKIYNSAPADTTMTMVDAADDNVLISGYIEVK